VQNSNRNHIKLKRVPSHIGIGGNETADQAAKYALNKDIGKQEPDEMDEKRGVQ
jgi:ribonuclease HI